MAKAKSVNPAQRPRIRLGVVMPLIIFAAITALFFVALFSGDPSKLPSALIGKPVPEFVLPPVEGLKSGSGQVPGFTNQDLARGKVSLVNVWASWCGPCHVEHPFLTQLAERGDIAMYGLNYKDSASAARRFLGRYGNPYRAVGQDDNGRIAINWGVYGVPETFIVDGSGAIVFKHVGPLDADVIERRLLPAVEKAREQG
jgi:cytochrome c biogenesis protein CcmG/thiol:disulfide interchange protein DsbE